MVPVATAGKEHQLLLVSTEGLHRAPRGLAVVDLRLRQGGHISGLLGDRLSHALPNVLWRAVVGARSASAIAAQGISKQPIEQAPSGRGLALRHRTGAARLHQ
jgi:hypothetical protein